MMTATVVQNTNLAASSYAKGYKLGADDAKIGKAQRHLDPRANCLAFRTGYKAGYEVTQARAATDAMKVQRIAAKKVA